MACLKNKSYICKTERVVYPLGIVPLVKINTPTDGLSTSSAILALFATTGSSYYFLGTTASNKIFPLHLWLKALRMPSCKANKLLPKPTGRKKATGHRQMPADHRSTPSYWEALTFLTLHSPLESRDLWKFSYL